MKHAFLLVLAGFFLSAAILSAANGKVIRFVYCSDLHYGLEREFRGAETGADSVSRAMIAAFGLLENSALPEDGGVSGGEIFGSPDFIVCTGDIANRMEDGVQSASASWEQFCSDWGKYISCTVHSGAESGPEDGCRKCIPLYLVPGNHDISNAIGYPKPLSPERDAASAAGIQRLMTMQCGDCGHVDAGESACSGKPCSTCGFDYSRDRTHYSFVMDSIRFVFMGMWPDSLNREWFCRETAADNDIPVFLFTHDPPEAESKHFTNPNGRHDINSTDRFQNLLSDTCSVKTTGEKPVENWRTLELFFGSHPEIKAYFHGDWNYNEFYTWHGPDGTISLPVFRVDSPMKGFISSGDETLLSFIVVTIDTGSHTLTARECLWNADRRPGIGWGETATVQY